MTQKRGIAYGLALFVKTKTILGEEKLNFKQM